MNYITSLLCIVLVQKVSSQFISYVPRSALTPNFVINQPQHIVANLNSLRSNGNSGISVTRSVPNTITAVPVANGVNGLMNTSPNSGQIFQISNSQPVNNQLANIQSANAQLSNNINDNAIISQGIATANYANLVNDNANLAAIAGNLANINGNIATFDLGNAFTVTSGSPGNQAFGIQILAEALEVGGKVNVDGKIPIFGTVTINGNVPTDGSAAVSYSCGQSAASAAV